MYTYNDVREQSIGSTTRFECDLIVEGRKCGQVFASSKALKLRRSKTHNCIPTQLRIVVSNQCPWCLAVFSSIGAARAHVRRRIVSGHCSKNKGLISPFNELILPKNLDCPICALITTEFTELQTHLLTHVSDSVDSSSSSSESDTDSSTSSNGSLEGQSQESASGSSTSTSEG